MLSLPPPPASDVVAGPSEDEGVSETEEDEGVRGAPDVANGLVSGMLVGGAEVGGGVLVVVGGAEVGTPGASPVQV